MALWRTLTLLVVLLVAGLNLWRTAQDAAGQLKHPQVDRVVEQEHRLASLRQSVVERGIRGTAGYFTDVPGDQIFTTFPTVEQYYLTQFALSPLVLDPYASDHPWTIVNLRTTVANPNLPSGYAVVEEFGDGLMLLKKGTP